MPRRRLLAVVLFAATGLGAAWIYRDVTQRAAMIRLDPDYQKLAELRASIFQAYAQRALLLERWMGREEFRRRRFPLPRELTTQDDFDLFEIGQNQISEELSKRLDGPRMKELFAIEEGISRTREEYQKLAAGVLETLDSVGVERRKPPTFALDKLVKSGR